jgi:hypothetical protein
MLPLTVLGVLAALASVAAAAEIAGCASWHSNFSQQRRFHVWSSLGSPLASKEREPSSDLAAVLAAAPANSEILLCLGDVFATPPGGFVVSKDNITIGSYPCGGAVSNSTTSNPLLTAERLLPAPAETYRTSNNLTVWRYDLQAPNLSAAHVWAV